MTDIRTVSTDVLIVGAGPSGLVAALLLARWKVRSIVVERNAETSDHPKAHELNARSIEILREVGITEQELAAEASPLEDASRVLFCRTINEELGRIDLLTDPARRRKYEENLQQTLPYLNLSQSEFEKILVVHARQCPLIDLRFGHKWVSGENADEHVTSVVESGAAYAIESRYLFGCDGASSRVRQAAGIAMEGPAEIQTFVNAFITTNLRSRVRTPAKLYWIMHPEYAGAFIAHHMEKRWVYAVPVEQPWERPEDFTKDVMRARIAGALGFDVPDVQVHSLSTWRMTAQVAERYRRGRVLLLGDAAHRFPPTGGLGMNTGIADAHNLAWKIGLVLAGGAGEALLDTYERERRPIAQKNCAESHTNFEKMFDVIRALGIDPNGMKLLARLMGSRPMRALPSRLRAMVKRMVTRPVYWFIGRVLRAGARRERVAAAIAQQTNHFDRLGLDIGYVYGEGAFVSDGSSHAAPANDVADFIPTTMPGARLPHRWVTTATGRRSVHDDLSYTRFSLLTVRHSVHDDPAIHVVDTSHYPPDLFPPDRALLVRPDGHVAWRGASEACDDATLRAIVSTVTSHPAPAEAINR